MADDKDLDTGHHPGPFDDEDIETGGENNRGRQPQRSASQRGQSTDGAAHRSDRSPLVTAASGEVEKPASQTANGVDRGPGANASLDDLVDGMSGLKLGDEPHTAAAAKTPTVETAPTPAVEKAQQRDSSDDNFDLDVGHLEAFDELYEAVEAGAARKADEKHLIAGETRDGQTPYLTRQQFHAAHSRWPTGQEPDTLVRDDATGTYRTRNPRERTSKMLIGRQDGTFVGVDPERAGMKNLKAEMDKYGPDNVRLRTQDGRFLTHDAYNAAMASRWDRKGHNPAEKAFAQFSGQTYAIQRDDAPHVALRTDEGLYESPDNLRKRGLELEGRAVLIATPNLGGYVDPPTLKWMIEKGGANIGHDYIDKAFSDAKLPRKLLNQRHVDAPITLVAIDRHTLASGVEAKKLQNNPSQPLYQAYEGRCFALGHKQNGDPTGNYSLLESYANNREKNLTMAQKQEFEVPGANVRGAEPTRAPAGATLPSQGAKPARPPSADLYQRRSESSRGL